MKQLDPKSIWLFFISFIIRFVVLFIIFFVSAGLPLMAFIAESSGETTIALTFLSYLAFGLVGFPVMGWIFAKLTYKYYKYELREDGFRKEHGIIWKKYVTIPYDRIQNVDIYRGVIARIFGLSDLQIQTAGGISTSSYGAFSEGRLPGLSAADAEKLRDEVIKRARHHRGQGL